MPSTSIDSLNIRARSYTREFLDCSWEWLNDPEIKALTGTPDFTRDQQLKWYSSLASQKTYLIWGLEINGVPAGVFGIKNVEGNSGEYWGYIGLKEYWGKGVGTWLMRKTLELAADAGIGRLYLKVLKDNVSAAALYRKMQFTVYASDEKFDWMERMVESA